MSAPEGHSIELDPLIHESARLRLISILNECEKAEFTFLLATTGLTRGNLSAHIAKLVGASYVAEQKQFVDRKPCSSYRLTSTGRNAYVHYLETWRKITKSQ